MSVKTIGAFHRGLRLGSGSVLTIGFIMQQMRPPGMAAVEVIPFQRP